MSTPFYETAWYALESATVDLCNRITDTGFPVNVAKGQALLTELNETSADLAEQLQIMLPPAREDIWFTPKRNNKVKGYRAGVPFRKGALVPYNPNSGRQFADRMIERHHWQPTELTADGDPKVTMAILATLPYPEARVLLNHKIASKRITMLSGERGILSMVSEDGRLHTEYASIGTVTGRATHKPNVAQVPAVELGDDDQPLLGAGGFWGYEFRDLFSAPEGWVLVGADQKGLEARILAHFLAPYDHGAYATLVTDATKDMHVANQQAAGLPSRAKAKRLLYATIYGVGNHKAGVIVEPDESDAQVLAIIGKMAKGNLIAGIGGFGDLLDWVQRQSNLIGLDGRPLTPRKAHARLNTLIQSAGAIVCKRWLLLIDVELERLGLHHGGNGDYEFLAWIHDEVQIGCRPETADKVAQVCRDMAVKAGEFYGLACPLGGSAKIGASWAATH